MPPLELRHSSFTLEPEPVLRLPGARDPDGERLHVHGVGTFPDQVIPLHETAGTSQDILLENP